MLTRERERLRERGRIGERESEVEKERETTLVSSCYSMSLIDVLIT